MFAFVLLFALLFGPAPLRAGQVAGDVRDPDGLIVPGVKVTLSSREMAARQEVTDKSGQFRFADLAPGDYRILVQAPGFLSWDLTFALADGQDLRTTFGLKIGMVTEVVNIVTAPPRNAGAVGGAAGAATPTGRGRGPAPPLTPRGSPTPLPAALPPPENLKAGGQLVEPKQTQHPLPSYPPHAAATGISGTVIVEAMIDADGKVVSPAILRGVETLDDAVLKSLGGWRYTPARLNGKAVAVRIVVSVNFTLR